MQDYVQRSAKVGAPGLVNFITAVAYYFCPSSLAAFTQPSASTLADLCMPIYKLCNILSRPNTIRPCFGSSCGTTSRGRWSRRCAGTRRRPSGRRAAPRPPRPRQGAASSEPRSDPVVQCSLLFFLDLEPNIGVTVHNYCS